uniref:SAM domain-containing protein n=1 Tax=Anopheles minimus TaxID=112268 RepID=A0A182WI08_9DIPT
MSSPKYAYEIGQLLKNLNATTYNIPPTTDSSTMPDQHHSHSVLSWTCENVCEWARKERLSQCIIDWIAREDVDGRCLLAITEQDAHDLPEHCESQLRFGDIKRFWFATRLLQRLHLANGGPLGLAGLWTQDYSMNGSDISTAPGHHPMHPHNHHHPSHHHHPGGTPHHPSTSSLHHHPQHASLLSSMGTSYGSVGYSYSDLERISPPMSIDGCATCIQPEFFKTMISCGK